MAVFFAEVGDIVPVASKIRSPSSPSMATRAKSLQFADSRAKADRWAGDWPPIRAAPVCINKRHEPDGAVWTPPELLLPPVS